MRRTAQTAFAVALLAIGLFSAMDAVMKGLSLEIGVYNALLWRGLAGIVISGIFFAIDGMRWPVKRSCAFMLPVACFPA